jgi:hypothetical protein
VTIDREFDFVKTAIKLGDYIKSKGTQPIGPLVQKTDTFVNDSGELEVGIKLIQQANNYISNCQSPFGIDPAIRVENCLYVRFVGEEHKLKYAYDKLGVIAYENDIELTGVGYTIFVDMASDDLIADIFMETKREV